MSFKSATPPAVPGYVMECASIRTSLVLINDIIQQKLFSSPMDSSTGPHRTGIIKKHGMTHKSRRTATDLIDHIYNKITAFESRKKCKYSSGSLFFATKCGIKGIKSFHKFRYIIRRKYAAPCFPSHALTQMRVFYEP